MRSQQRSQRSRRARRTGDLLKKAAIWLFLVAFLASVVGVALVTATR